MWQLTLSSVVLLHLALFVPPVASAAEIHEGIAVAVATNTLVLSDPSGQVTQSWKVAPHATIHLNGRPARLVDVKPGDSVTVVTRQSGRRAELIVRIDAHSG